MKLLKFFFHVLAESYSSYINYIPNPSLLHFTVVNINKGKPAGPTGIDLQVKELRPGDMLLGVPPDRALNVFERL